MSKFEFDSPLVQGERAAADCVGPINFVSANRDLPARPGADQDSWFLFGYFDSDRGVLPYLVHLMNVNMPSGDRLMQSMYSVLDPGTGKYLTEEYMDSWDDCTLATDKLEVITPWGKLWGNSDKMQMTCKFEDTACDLTITNKGFMLPNNGNGLQAFIGGLNYHYALPTMEAEGTITVFDKTYKVSGPAWLDRQYGITPRFFKANNLNKWIWFGIQFDNGDRMSVWDIDEPGILHSNYATLLHPSGGVEILSIEPLLPLASEPWTSPDTGFSYPSLFRLNIPAKDAKLIIDIETPEQEIISPIGLHRLEATTKIVGVMDGKEMSGRVIIECVGKWDTWI